MEKKNSKLDNELRSGSEEDPRNVSIQRRTTDGDLEQARGNAITEISKSSTFMVLSITDLEGEKDKEAVSFCSFGNILRLSAALVSVLNRNPRLKMLIEMNLLESALERRHDPSSGIVGPDGNPLGSLAHLFSMLGGKDE